VDEIRRLALDDLDACLALAVDRQWSPERAKWTLVLECGTGYCVDDPAGGLAATVVVTSFQRDVAVIGMMLVAQRRSREGLGRRLMGRALEHSGHGVCFLYATELGQPLYEQLGFVTTDTVTKHLGRLRGPVGDDGPGLRPGRPVDLSAVTALDGAVFGADRGPLLARLITSSERFVVLEQDGAVTGYGLAWRNHNVVNAGPIVAPDRDGASRILARLAAGQSLPVRVDVPAGRDDFSRWLQGHGLGSASPAVPVPMMTFKARALPGERAFLYAIGCQATG
jgi:GNAT superfamily N-acetyltransferase